MKTDTVAALRATLAAAAVGLATPASAANETMLRLLEVLHAQGTLDAATYAQLKSVAEAEPAPSAAAGSAQTAPAQAPAPAPVGSLEARQRHLEQRVEELAKAAPPPAPTVKTEGRLEFTSPDGAFSWRIGGRVHVDSVFTDNDHGAGPTTNLEDRTTLRRARLELAGTLWEHWRMKLAYDFGDTNTANERGLRDAWLRYVHASPAPLSFTVGQQHEFISLEELTSSNDMSFVERSLVAAAFNAANGRRLGAGATLLWRDAVNLSLGLFGREIGNDLDDGLKATGRVVWLPYQAKDRLLHLGLAGSWVEDFDDGTFRSNPRPELDEPSGSRLVRTAVTDVDGAARLGAEAAVVQGPFSVQGEYQRFELSRPVGLSDPAFDGWYLMASWLLTGESRGYSLEEGRFKAPKPRTLVGQGGWGAWELVARYTDLDLLDAGEGGGEQRDLTLGVNWYATPNIRFLANWVQVLDIEGNAFEGAEPSGVSLATRLYW